MNRKGNEAMKAPPGSRDKERADAIEQHDRQGEDQHLQGSVAIGSIDALGAIGVGRQNDGQRGKRHCEQQDEVTDDGLHGAFGLSPHFQPRRERVNWAPESEVQLSWLGLTRAQLTLDWVLRTSEVILISTSVGEVLM